MRSILLFLNTFPIEVVYSSVDVETSVPDTEEIIVIVNQTMAVETTDKFVWDFSIHLKRSSTNYVKKQKCNRSVLSCP